MKVIEAASKADMLRARVKKVTNAGVDLMAHVDLMDFSAKAQIAATLLKAIQMDVVEMTVPIGDSPALLESSAACHVSATLQGAIDELTRVDDEINELEW